MYSNRTQSRDSLQQVSHDEDEFQQFEEDNSFQKQNNVYELTSQKNNLQLELRRMKLILNARQGQINDLKTKNYKHEHERQQFIQKIKEETEQKQFLKHQLGINRKTAEFHLSNEYGDDGDMINELVKKDKIIESLKQEAIVHQHLHNEQINHLKFQTSRKQAQIEEITKKLEEKIKQNSALSMQVKEITQMAIKTQKQIAKLNAEKYQKQSKKDEQKIIQEKLSEQKIQLQKELILLKQEFHLSKSEIGSIRKLNEYLENTNKEHEQMKLKLQKQLADKQILLGKQRQQHADDIHVLKKTFATQKKAYYDKIIRLEQQLMLSPKKHESQETTRRLKEQNLMLREKAAENLHQEQKRIRREYKEIIDALQDQIMTLKTRKDQGQQVQKLSKVYQISKLQVQEYRVKSQTQQQQLIRLKHKNQILEKQKKDLKEDIINLQQQYDQLNQKYKTISDLNIKIQQMAQQIDQERKKHSKRKHQSSYKQSEHEVSQYKDKIKQLQQQLQQQKHKNKRNIQQMEEKVNSFTQQLNVINRDRSFSRELQEEKKKLTSYIEELEQKSFNKRAKTQMETLLEEEHLKLKFQYSQALKQINIYLQRYKKLEEIHSETLAKLTSAQQHYNIINQKYTELFKEKSRANSQLNSAYDQINKLNYVLMGKEEQLQRLKNKHKKQERFYSARFQNHKSRFQ